MTLIKNPEEMEAFGTALAKTLTAPAIITLEGDLGAGKTTLVRGFLRSFGYAGTVKSPTYNIVESYTFDDFVLHHFDLYRIKSLFELEEMGFSDYFDSNTICLIEWPEIAKALLPRSTVCCSISIDGDYRHITR